MKSPGKSVFAFYHVLLLQDVYVKIKFNSIHKGEHYGTIMGRAFYKRDG